MNLHDRLRAKTEAGEAGERDARYGIVWLLCKVVAVERQRRRRAEARITELESRFQTLREQFDGLVKERPWKEWRA
jgi:hypothetical protein